MFDAWLRTSRTIFVDVGYDEKRASSPDAVVQSLDAAARLIVNGIV